MGDNNNEVLENQNEQENTGSEQTNNENEGTAKTYTAEEYSKAIEDAKKEAQSKVYEGLGFKQGDKKMAALLKSFIASQKEANKHEEKPEQELKDAENRAVIAEAKAEAMMQGVNAAYVEDVVTLALARVANGSGDLKTVIGEFKTKYPVWFAASESDDKDNKGMKGTGSSIGGSGGKDKQTKGIGARLAAQRGNKSTKKSGMWSR